MNALVLTLGASSFLISLVGTAAMIRIGRALGALDTAPIEGQVKESPRAVPNTGGVAIAAGIWVPMLAGLLAATFLDPSAFAWTTFPIEELWPELTRRVELGWGTLAVLMVIHAVGVLDDRRPMGAMPKLLVMLAAALFVALAMDTRLMTMLDPLVGGSWLSVLLTVVWVTLVVNAMNFIDNTDGLSAGVALIAGALFLVAALLSAQWFVGATLALLVGACAGFLVFNFPPAKVFMGDGGSLVLGILLAITTVRTTYIPEGGSAIASSWYALLMPLAVLAVPLYDFASVTLIRLSQGKSPFRGDLQHFPHRIRARGLSARSTILVIYALTAGSGIAGILLTRAGDLEAALLGIQIACVIAALAIFEYKARDR